ncbi:MAG: carboxypeptidase regulatory-like domain-containing protein [Planctomycetes bacterium]|nr:carboxypeptidase regulatory-like domain-containing protein [Planctomycetota bacterium]
MRSVSRSSRELVGLVLGASILTAQAHAALRPRDDEALELVLRAGPEARPVAGLRVMLGERATTSGPDGIARFEGVIAGSHRVVIAALGFERWEGLLEIKEGARERIGVPLVPERLVRVTGRVVLRELGVAIAGARVRLLPLEVRSAVRGSLELASDWEGRFALLDVPAGRYRAELQAPGCLRAQQELELGGAPRELVLELEQEIARAVLEVEVVDDAGAPVAAAELLLSEAPGSGEIRRGTSGADGRCSFPDLLVALRNVAASDGRLRASRREVLLHASSLGHRPAFVAVALEEERRIRLVLARLGEVLEREPNDLPERAQEIEPGQSARFRIAKRGDHDWFALRLPEAGQLELRFGGAAGCDVHVEVRDEQGQRVAARGASRGKEVTESWALQAGLYRLRFSDWGDDEVHAVEQRFVTRVALDRPRPLAVGPLRLEPGGVLRAAWGSAEEPLRASFALAQPAVVRFASSAAPAPRRLQLRSRAASFDDAFAVAPAGGALVAESWLPAGEYELALLLLESSAPSAPLLELRCDAIACSSRAEPRPLALESLVVAGGVPHTELDAYRIALPSAGVLRVRASTRGRQSLRVIGADGALLAAASSDAGGRCAAVASIEGAGEVRVELGADELEAWGPVGALLRTEWLPCEEAELGGRDDEAPLATPLELPAVLAGNLVPRGDVDRVRLDFERAGVLVLEGVAAVPLDVRVRASNGSEVSRARFDPLGEELALALPAGSHALEIRALDASAWSAAGYRLRVRRKGE